MIALRRQPMFKWVHIILILLMIGLLLPTNSALAQPPAAISGINLVQDPSFEASYSSSAYWRQSSTNSFVICSIAGCGDHSTAGPRTGSTWVWFGGMDFTEPGDVSPEVGDVYQNIVFPQSSCKATLQFYLWIGQAASGSDANDNFRALVDGQVVFTANATQKNSYSGYKPVSIDVSQFANGAVHKLEFDSKVSRQLVSFNLDDISLVAERCTRAVKGDFNGDRKREIAVFRPSESTWYIWGIGTFVFGTVGDIPVVADYNGDMRAEIGVFRPSESTWYIWGIGTFLFGTVGDIPVVGDYNGDGKDDIAVFRPSNSTWYIWGVGIFPFGAVGDIPVVGDYNGDGKDDIAVFRPSESTWYIGGLDTFVFGTVGDIPVVADYNGDGKDEIAVFRPSNSTWYIWGVGIFPFGAVGDIPAPGDYNGDGKADITIFRPSTSTWFVNGLGTFMFGTVGDIPVPQAVPGS